MGPPVFRRDERAADYQSDKGRLVNVAEPNPKKTGSRGGGEIPPGKLTRARPKSVSKKRFEMTITAEETGFQGCKRLVRQLEGGRYPTVCRLTKYSFSRT
jgi:hypothetical protein